MSRVNFLFRIRRLKLIGLCTLGGIVVLGGVFGAGIPIYKTISENITVSFDLENENVGVKDVYRSGISFKDFEADKITFKRSDNRTITLPEAKCRGYEFTGWYLSDDPETKCLGVNSKEFGYVNKPKESFKVFPRFKPIEYQIAYSLDGGVNSEENITSYTISPEVFVLKDASRTNYDFEGWKDENGYLITEINLESCKDYNLRATWFFNKFIISLSYEGINNPTSIPNLNNDSKIYYDINSPNIVLNDAECDGYVFDGWYKGNEKISYIEHGSVGNISLVARFHPIEYTVTLDPNGGTVTPSQYTYTIEDENITLPVPQRTDFVFDGWFKDNELVTVIDTSLISSYSLQAKWSPIPYYIHLSYEGINNPSSTPDLHNDVDIMYNVESEDIVLQDAECAGYVFEGWYDGVTKVTVIPHGTTGNINLVGKFHPIQYTVTLDPNGGSIAQSEYTYTIESDDLALPEATRAGYVFDGWYDGDNKVETISASSISNYNLTARWDLTQNEQGYRQIYNIDQLKYVSTLRDAKYILMNDLDITGQWLPLCYNSSFTGEFDGNNHTISFSSINLPTQVTRFGLFDKISGSVSNLTLVGQVHNIAVDKFGGLSVTIDGGAISNVSYQVDTELFSIDGTSILSCGGLAGDFASGYIRNCSASGKLKVLDAYANNVYLGGLVGNGAGGVISNSFATSTTLLQANAIDKAYVGGVVGYKPHTTGTTIYISEDLLPDPICETNNSFSASASVVKVHYILGYSAGWDLDYEHWVSDSFAVDESTMTVDGYVYLTWIYTDDHSHSMGWVKYHSSTQSLDKTDYEQEIDEII